MLAPNRRITTYKNCLKSKQYFYYHYIWVQTGLQNIDAHVQCASGEAFLRDSDVLCSFALFYQRCSRDDWEQLIEETIWQDFLTSVNSGIARLPVDSRKNEALSASSLEPLPYEEFKSFADRHFTGGLPGSIMAVESLYRNWTSLPGAQLVFSQDSGLYDSDSAAHMRYLYDSLGIELEAGNILPPDHLSLLLEFLALLIDEGRAFDADTFISEHLDWLPALLETIRKLTPEAHWRSSVSELLIAFVKSLRFQATIT